MLANQMLSSSKIFRLSELISHQEASHDQRIALCFGQFNVIHPGHIRYLQFAKGHGSRLVVAIEGDSFLSTMDRSRTFPETARAEALSAVGLVDQVIILDSGKLDVLVKHIQPSVLVLGKEYESENLDKERIDKVEAALSLMTDQNGKIIYASGETHYATDDIFRATQGELEKERWAMFKESIEKQSIDLSSIFDRLEQSDSKHLLVIGDTIVDRYIACDPVGMSNEAPVVVVRELDSRDFVGGAGIVAAHVAGLGAGCQYLSVLGDDDMAEYVESRLTNYNVNPLLIKDNSRPTTFKIRYLVENQKLFRVSRLKDHSLSKNVESDLIDRIAESAAISNGIVVSDFVYGVITPTVLAAIKKVSEKFGIPIFGDLQCSSQVGSVSKFYGYDLICPTEREARIALDNKDDGLERVANLLLEKTSATNLIIKLGAEGFIAYSTDNKGDLSNRQHFPALAVNPVDVTGAGDALLAAMAVGFSCHLNLMESAAIGSCISALAVQTIGNKPITIQRLERFLRLNGIE